MKEIARLTDRFLDAFILGWLYYIWILVVALLAFWLCEKFAISEEPSLAISAMLALGIIYPTWKGIRG